MNPENQENFLETWERQNEELINNVVSSIQENEAVVIEGETHSGKTSSALIAANRLKKEQEDLNVVFTTPAVQETFGAKPIKDRTGVEYIKLPSLDEVKKGRQTLIVLDEVSTRGPNPAFHNFWRELAELPNVKIIFLSHTNNKYLEEWKEVLGDKEIGFCKI